MLQKPAEYKINWIRVYQDKNDPKQKVGCSTKERPTRKFIKAHEKKYMLAEDVSTFALDLISERISTGPAIETNSERRRTMLACSLYKRYIAPILRRRNPWNMPKETQTAHLSMPSQLDGTELPEPSGVR
jgi:hypothetical protein